jgi:hypothetical protein
LLIEIQVNSAGFDRLNSAEQVNQRAAQPVYRPRRHNVEASALRILEHLIEAGTIIAGLTAAAWLFLPSLPPHNTEDRTTARAKRPRRRRSLPKAEQAIEKGPAIVSVLYLSERG